MFLQGCKKDNHDTIALIGDESYKSPIDTVYPKKYRALWKSLVPSCSDTVYEGIFPPDMTGLYVMEGSYKGGNVKLYSFNVTTFTWEYSLYDQYPTPAYFNNLYGKEFLYLLIEEQNNGIAKLKFNTSYKSPLEKPYDYDDWKSVDTAYIWGNGEDGSFTMCFSHNITQDNGDVYNQGYVVNGRKKITDGNLTDTITNMESWTVIKRRDPDVDKPYIFQIGGQTMYFSKLVVKEEQ